MLKTITKYGRFIHGDTKDCVRYDTYISNEGVKEIVRVIVNGPSDNSCVHDHSTLPGGRYNSKCSCCWLNITHSVDCHNERINRNCSYNPPFTHTPHQNV